MRNSARVKSLDSQIRDHIMKAKAFTEAAAASGKTLTAVEDVKVKEHLASIETLKAEREGLIASEDKADRLRAGVRDLGEWRLAAKSLVEGRQTVTLNGLNLFGKSVTDSDLATDSQTGRAVIERPGITPLPLDQRYVFGLFPRGGREVDYVTCSARRASSGRVARFRSRLTFRRSGAHHGPRWSRTACRYALSYLSSSDMSMWGAWTSGSAPTPGSSQAL